MKLEFYNGAIGYQTIYRLIIKNQWSCLLQRKAKRYRQRQGDEARARFISGHVDIDERPDLRGSEKRGRPLGEGCRPRPRWIFCDADRAGLEISFDIPS
ncbi:MAG: hypothetical protein QS748_10160 [Candidatus Endonucleobacter bathymodioli]|uniref:Transposase n=1 Tax=Candidatus Endonucleibacter bathymodioli TaxID=539814 RepID=A0AA90NUD1_9GAMM|nr:hypothetical protein [Candidatus Endonucleobacter bathymodioli]